MLKSLALCVVLGVLLASPSNAAECFGYTGPGGACYAGPGGGLNAGPKGGLYTGPGGGLYAGPGGGLYTGPGGGMYSGPGGGLYTGPGGGLYTGPGGGVYTGPLRRIRMPIMAHLGPASLVRQMMLGSRPTVQIDGSCGAIVLSFARRSRMKKPVSGTAGGQGSGRPSRGDRALCVRRTRAYQARPYHAPGRPRATSDVFGGSVR